MIAFVDGVDDEAIVVHETGDGRVMWQTESARRGELGRRLVRPSFPDPEAVQLPATGLPFPMVRFSSSTPQGRRPLGTIMARCNCAAQRAPLPLQE